MTNYSFKPSILHHLRNDMQFKQVFKGMTGTKDVQARKTNTAFSISHQGGNFTFSQPSEIQYEIRKKTGPLEKPVRAKVTSLNHRQYAKKEDL